MLHGRALGRSGAFVVYSSAVCEDVDGCTDSVANLHNKVSSRASPQLCSERNAHLITAPEVSTWTAMMIWDSALRLCKR